MTVTEEERKYIHQVIDRMLDDGEKCMIIQRAWIDEEYVMHRKMIRVYLNVGEDTKTPGVVCNNNC